MMATEAQISADLAIVGRTSRERLVTLDATLRAVGAIREVTTPSALEVPMTTFAPVFGVRVARAAAGALSLVFALALVVYLATPMQSMADFGDSWFDGFLQLPIAWAAVVMFGLLATIHVGAAWLAARRFRAAVRAAANPVEHARRLLRRAAGPGLAGAISGTMAFVLLFGMLQVVVGEYGMVTLLEPHDAGWAPEQTWMAGPLTAGTLSFAILASTLGALLVARVQPQRWGRRLILGAIVLGLVTVWLGMRFDIGPIHVSFHFGQQPSVLLRVGLTAMGTAALFVIVTGFALWRHRRELAVIDLAGR